MSEAGSQPVTNDASQQPALPERLCTWCKVPMTKRLVAGGAFLHYTCPKCVFQHTIAWKTSPDAAGAVGKH